MSFEYKIRFTVPADLRAEHVSARLPDPRIEGSAWTSYDFTVDADGFTFVDHARSAASALAFRGLVDAALACAPSVIVEEL